MKNKNADIKRSEVFFMIISRSKIHSDSQSHSWTSPYHRRWPVTRCRATRQQSANKFVQVEDEEEEEEGRCGSTISPEYRIRDQVETFLSLCKGSCRIFLSDIPEKKRENLFWPDMEKKWLKAEYFHQPKKKKRKIMLDMRMAEPSMK